MSSHSTVARRSTFASIRSARRWRYGARPPGPRAAQPGKASCAARTARSTSSAPARETAASRRWSIGEMSSKRSVARQPLAADEVVGRDGDAGDVDPVAGGRDAHSSANRGEVVDRVGEREAEALAHPHGRQRVVLLVRCAVELERCRALPDLRDRALAAPRADELVHRGIVVAAGLEPREVAHVDERRIVVGRARLRDALERDGSLGEAPVVRRERAAVDRACLQPGVGEAVEPERPRHPDGAELLREPLDPAADEREVPIDPDVRAGGHLLAVEHRIDDEEELLVLAAGRVDQLVARRRCRTASRRRARRLVRDRRGSARGLRGGRPRPRPGRPSTR